jgi:hypothetical protein
LQKKQDEKWLEKDYVGLQTAIEEHTKERGVARSGFNRFKEKVLIQTKDEDLKKLALKDGRENKTPKNAGCRVCDEK